MITAIVDSAEVEKMLGVHARQAPYILATAINNTMLEGQKEVINHATRVFTIRRASFLKRTMKMVEFANKAKIRATLATADLGGKPTADIFAQHEAGGTKTQRGSNVAIPTQQIRPTITKVVSKGNRPRNLKNSFKIKTKTGQQLILSTKGRGKHKKNIVAYVLEPSVHLKPRLDFIPTVGSVIQRKFNDHFTKAYDKALATAK